MRTMIQSLILLLSLAASLPAAQEFPYKAYTNRDEVYVRSGPGDDYYPTDKLRIGQELEIYRHDPGGWFAVRPPQGSFSWVSGRYLELQKNRLAKVRGERVAARVGSKFSEIRDVIQVRLQKDEVVEILDSATTSDAQGEKTVWYKIAPPSGEFRWVFGKYVDPDYPADGLRKPTTVRAASMTADAPAPRRDRPVVAEVDREPGRVVPPPSARVAAENRGQRVAVPAPPRIPSDGAPPVAAPVAMRHASPEEYQAQLDELDLKLSTMVAEEITVWTFAEIQPKANELLEQAQTAVERGRARLLLNKVNRFAEIKQRYETVNSLRNQVDHRNTELAQQSRQRAEAVPAESPADRYDGVGRLSRVRATGADSPRYALTGGDGEVRCYVSPAPGVNLQNYVGHQVGVNGVRGYLPDKQANHVMAKHVMLLDDSRLR